MAAMVIDEAEYQILTERLSKMESRLMAIEKEKLIKKEWYSITEVADHLNTSPISVRRLINRGLLKKSLGLRHIRIPHESLEEYKRQTLN